MQQRQRQLDPDTFIEVQYERNVRTGEIDLFYYVLCADGQYREHTMEEVVALTPPRWRTATDDVSVNYVLSHKHRRRPGLADVPFLQHERLMDMIRDALANRPQ